MCFHTRGQCEYWRQYSVAENRQVGHCRWSVVQCRHLRHEVHPAVVVVVVVAAADDVDRCFTDNVIATDRSTSFSQRFSFLVNI